MSGHRTTLSPTLERPALVDSVRRALASGSVVLVAEAGYGKTTLLEQALRRSVGATAWVTCSPREREAGQLLARLMAAVKEAVPGGSDRIGDLLVASPEPVDPVVAADELLVDLRRLLVDPLTIVLDQAEHLAGDTRAMAIVRALVHAADGVMQVGLSTRVPLDLRLAKLEAEGRVHRLGVADLAFTAGDCAAYLELATGLVPDDALVEAVAGATEGWPLAVGVSVLSLRHRPPVATRPDDQPGPIPLRSLRQIRSFFLEEVLDSLDPTTRAALIDSSVCRLLSPDIAAPLGLPAGFLDTVIDAGLFLRRIDPGSERMVYHPLFRECLLERLAAERSEDQVAALHRRAARAMAASGEPVDAVEHLLAGRDWQGAIDAVARHGGALLRLSPQLVREWLGRLPPEGRRDPRLRFLSGSLAWLAGDVTAALDRLAPLVTDAGTWESKDDAGLRWLARFKLMEVMYVTGRLEDAVELGRAFESAAPADAMLAAGVGVLAANCLAALGRAAESHAIAASALRLPGAEAGAATDVVRRAHLEIPAGNLDDNLRDAMAALRALERDDPFLVYPNVLALVAYVVTEQGDRLRALEWWRRVEVEARASLMTRLLGPSQAWQALLLAQGGEVAESEAALAAAGPMPAGWLGYIGEVARAVMAAGRGDRVGTVAAAEGAHTVVRAAPTIYRVWAAADVVPALVRVGAVDQAATLLAEAATLIDRTYPDASGAFLRARVRALEAWLAWVEGDAATSDERLAGLFGAPVPGLPYVVVHEWPRLEHLLPSALERRVVNAATTMRMVTQAFPDGMALVPFLDHVEPGVRRAAIGPALASGHPDARIKVARLVDDADAGVAAAARATVDTMAILPPPRVFTLLGGFSVRRGAWTVDAKAWGRPVAPRLVRFLLVMGGARVAEEVVLESLWPELEPASARRSLQVAVSRVRAALDAPDGRQSAVAYRDGTYGLVLGEADVVDSVEFQHAAAKALAAPPPNTALLERAAKLWTGEPLPEERYQDWATVWRERLIDSYAAVLSALAAACEREGNFSGAVSAARQLVALDPFDEAAHRQLMAAYARAGRRGAALRQYLECRRALVDGLGVEPTAATARLQARILAGEGY